MHPIYTRAIYMYKMRVHLMVVSAAREIIHTKRQRLKYKVIYIPLEA